jgi:hypothetical protein
MRHILIALLALLTLSTTAQKSKLPAFRKEDQPSPAPDYSQAAMWSTLPFHQDEADIIPKGEQWVSDSLKEADVFYIYPTIYTKGKTWTADLSNKNLNKRIDKFPVHFHASVFNASARVYTPRYRQGIIDCFYDTINGPLGLDFAYQDVRAAFLYYMEHYNHGRPIIIASHSQGSSHAWRLLREFFDTSALRKQLVCAYVVGMGVDGKSYQMLRPCPAANQTGCYVTWSSFKMGYDPGKSVLRGAPNVNPITWTYGSAYAEPSQTKGGIFLKIKRRRDHAVGAQIHDDYLWVKNKMPIIRSWKVLHLVDYNLFWFDIRQNVADRVKEYLHPMAGK